MAKIELLSEQLLGIMVSRLAQELVENYDDFKDTVILGMQPRGVFLAERVSKRILAETGISVPVGYLDITFDRDDFRRRPVQAKANETKVPFIIEEKKVVLIDDVLYSGRSIRAALTAMLSFGRPAKVELLVMIDRMYGRDLPIQPNYIGKSVNTIQSQKVIVEWKEQGFEKDTIWLVNQADSN